MQYKSKDGRVHLPAIYARQSKGDDEGIVRQVALCQQLIDMRGWSLVQVYQDNEVSASKVRGHGTGWAQMLADRDRGLINVVVATNLDRLLRNTRDLNTLIDAKLWAVTVDGEIDLSTAEGEFYATMLASIARFEVRRKSERQRRANAFRANNGYSLSSTRRFGYLPALKREDGSYVRRLNTEPDEREAAAFRQGVNILLHSGSTTAVAKAWNDAGVFTVNGKRWSAGDVTQVLRNPAYAGWVTRKDERGYVESHGVKDVQSIPLISQDEHEAIRAILDPKRTGPRTGKAVKSLLSGIAICGKCGGVLVAGKAAATGRSTYLCRDYRHMSRYRQDIDEAVKAVVIAFLSQDYALKALTGEDKDSELEAIARQTAVERARMDGFTTMLANGEMTRENYAKANRITEQKLEKLTEQRAKLLGGNALGDLLKSDDLATAFTNLDIDRQRQVIQKVISRIVVHPTKPGPGGRSRNPADYMEITLRE